MDTSLIVLLAVFSSIEVFMKIFTTINLAKTWQQRETSDSIVWLILIWVLNTLGWVFYLFMGRIKEEKKTDETWD